MTAYYNEFDPKAAAWIRELIKRGLVADGVVDERSILDVEPTDLAGFTQCHFFAGIAGWSYALRLAGWPDDRPCWTGSAPCQPFSAAGCQLGKDDARHLAPHFISLVGACRPGVLFGEQVASAAVFGKAAKRTRKEIANPPPPEWAWLDDIQDRLEAARYAVGSSDIPAAGVGAAHIRQRTFYGAVRLDDPASARHVGAVAGAESDPRDEARLRVSGAGRADGGLADAEMPERELAGVTRSRRAGFTDDGPDCGLADSSSTGLQGHGGDGDGSREPGRVETRQNGSAGAQGPASGLEHGESDGRQQWRPEPSGRGAASGRGSVGLADAQRAGSRGRRLHGPGESRETSGAGAPTEPVGTGTICGVGRPDATDSPWGVADWLFCRDGKWRPVKSSILGISDGVPGELVRSGAFVPAAYPLAQPAKESRRVMRLKGYGNAICPQAAAEFIKAFDASTECLRLTEIPEMTTDNNQGVFG